MKHRCWPRIGDDSPVIPESLGNRVVEPFGMTQIGISRGLPVPLGSAFLFAHRITEKTATISFPRMSNLVLFNRFSKIDVNLMNFAGKPFYT